MKYRYIMNMGLAFDEDRAMKKLCQMAKEGWFLKEMTNFRYRLVKGEPKELIYSMDCKELGENENEYFDIFKGSDWKHMCSYGPFHFFSAPPDTVPIYTEKESYLKKYDSAKKAYNKTAAITSIILMSIFIAKNVFSNEINGTFAGPILFILSLISVALAAPSIAVSIAFFIRERRIKKGKVC